MAPTMPSISLVAFVAAVIPLIVKRNLVYERKKKQDRTSIDVHGE